MSHTTKSAERQRFERFLTETRTLDIDVNVGDAGVWGVRLQRVSPADLVLDHGEMGALFAEREMVGYLEQVQEMARGQLPAGASAELRERWEGMTAEERAQYGQSQLLLQLAARERLKPAHVSEKHARGRQERMGAAIRRAVVAIRPGSEWLEVQLTDGARDLDGDPMRVPLADLPSGFAVAVWPHVRRYSAGRAQEVAASMARFRQDAPGAASATGEPAAAGPGAGDIGMAD